MVNISEFGLKIKNIKAATLYSYNLGLRNHYDYTDAMFSKSLFQIYMLKHGLNVHKESESTRDIICLEFDFGTRSYEEEMTHLKKMYKEAESDESRLKIQTLIDNVVRNQELYKKKTKDEIREIFYTENVTITYKKYDKSTDTTIDTPITYKMLYRNASKAKTGQVMFINIDLYKKAYNWLTMGLGNKLPENNAKIVEMSAYAPLVTSTIIDTLHIPVEDILILKDQDSFFTTIADIVKSDEYEVIEKKVNFEQSKIAKQNAIDAGKINSKGHPIYRKIYEINSHKKKKCIVSRELTDVKNTLWDGMALIEADILPLWVNGMALLRNHFFKACGFKSYLQKFFRDWCVANNHDYETYEIKDMFGISHKLKDIKVITTDNAIKWKKFISLMGGTEIAAYQYWCSKINKDGSNFGIVKTDHSSKLGDVQQLSYQMVNTLPCIKKDIEEITSISKKYVESLKNDNTEFLSYLLKNSNDINHYEMLSSLYKHNPDISKTKYFKTEKSQIIKNYVNHLRKGKITVEADNLTFCGNPYALLLYAVGENYENDPTLTQEPESIQCYTTRFADNEYLCAFRNPHNSPNNICYLHNRYSPEMQKYFLFSPNIIAINCIHTDIQARANGMDEDSDFMLVTNQANMVRLAKFSYQNFPTVVNALSESGITYNNTALEYARMDNKFAKSQLYIGESSNLAQLAMTYYWTEIFLHGQETDRAKELYDNVVILAVLAQVVIDGCKREYEVDAPTEIDRIKALPCMTYKKQIFVDNKAKTIKYNLPNFMKYTKEIPRTKNGIEIPYEIVKAKKDMLNLRINPNFICPMNWLQEVLDQIPDAKRTEDVNLETFFIKNTGKPNNRQMSKIRKIIEEYDRKMMSLYMLEESKEKNQQILHLTQEVIDEISKIKISNSTISRLLETALGLDKNVGGKHYKNASKYTRRMLNILFKTNREKFLYCFSRESSKK